MEIKSIAIVSAGEAGRRLARACLLGGYPTVLEDVAISTVQEAIAWIVKSIGDEATRGRITPRFFMATMSKLSIAGTAEDACRESDLVIETVADEIEMKIELFTIFDKFAKPGAIFASTTSKLAIGDLAEVTVCPERCIGMRFVAEGEEIQRVELVAGVKTSGETIAACRKFAQRVGKEVAIGRDEDRLTGCPESGVARPLDPAAES